MMFFHVQGGVPPLGLLKPPLSCKNHVAAKMRVWRPTFRVQRPTFRVWRPTFCVLWLTRQLRKQKVAGPRNFFHFFENFSKFFGIFKGENTLFSKSAQKMVQFQKKITLYFSTSRGGGSRPQSGNFHFLFLFFFLNPSLSGFDLMNHKR